MCHMDTGSFTVQIKTEDSNLSFRMDVEKRFDTSNYELGRPLPRRKYKKGIGLMKDNLGCKKMPKTL